MKLGYALLLLGLIQSSAFAETKVYACDGKPTPEFDELRIQSIHLEIFKIDAHSGRLSGTAEKSDGTREAIESQLAYRGTDFADLELKTPIRFGKIQADAFSVALDQPGFTVPAYLHWNYHGVVTAEFTCKILAPWPAC